jgi:hypothetical protein
MVALLGKSLTFKLILAVDGLENLIKITPSTLISLLNGAKN